ncbi:PREDICTED: methyl-CpG-binding domain protein 3-like 1-like [Chrysochloris asiatica]|uniref:Methyl-CpG-binding domain protein 3-like 1-like n=1 Tax=Chrysochloris asiatica TaxID=185453 RepID=A0A9B0X3Z6_CHRAS|nr:PREDICTED: methyl-CpG-binding domain protein 3-like 1-like [Chrysochloris asiatica]
MSQTPQKRLECKYKAKSKRRSDPALPIRLTSCIFPSPVTRVMSHPSNEVRCSQWEEKLEKPQQVSAYRRLQGLQACSSTGELLNTLDFTNTLKTVVPCGPGKVLRHIGDGDPCSHSQLIPGQSSNVAEIIPGVGLHLSSHFQEQQITYGEIGRQTQNLMKARENLAEALQADMLAKKAERFRLQEGHHEN